MAGSVWEFCAAITEQKVDGRKFGEALQVDGLPLWYFLDPFYLPKPFKSWSKVDKIVAKEVRPSRAEGLKISMLSPALRTWLAFNERRKIRGPKKKAGKIKPKKKDVLFLTHSNQVFEKGGKFSFLGLDDVLRDLEKRGVEPLVVVCDLLSNPFYKYRRYPNAPDYLVSMYEYVDREILKDSKSLSKKLNREWKRIDKPSLFSFKGRDYWAAMKGGVNFVLSREMLSMTLAYYMTFKKIIQAHDVKVVYLTGIGMHELPLLAAARNLGKRAVYSAHGYGLAMEDIGTMMSSGKYRDVVFFAAGEEQRRKLYSGVKSGNVVITGSPFFDKVAGYRSRKVEHGGKKVVVHLSSALVEYGLIGKDDYFKYIRNFLSQVSRVKEVGKVVIRPHPLEKHIPEYKAAIKSLGLKNVEIAQRPDKEALYSVLSKSDLVVSTISTADIEALMLDKDVILVDGLRKSSRAEQAEAEYQKVVLEVDKDGDLAGIITKVLTDRKMQKELEQRRRKYVEDSFYRIDGKAHERVADSIKSLI